MKFLLAGLFASLCLCLSATAFAKTTLPKNLDAADRERALEILGYGSSAKILGDPYPLGGYPGVEIGLSTEFISMEDLAALGSKSDDKGDFNFYTLTIGKGLYYNVDVLLYFSPPVQSESFQNYGAQLRWGFYEFSFFPLTLSTVLSGGGANFSNLINVYNMSLDLIGTVNIDNVALYFGGGRARSDGTFIGGANGITDNGETARLGIVHDHTVFGVNISLAKVFVALEIDRYADTTYAGKLGYRF
jgi:hypothetical protein